MYEVNAASVLEAYGSFVEGSTESTLLAVASSPLLEAERTALVRSAARLGFGERPWAWCALHAEGVALGPDELAVIAEGLDPLGVVLADADAHAAFCRAFHCDVPLPGSQRVLGRPVVALEGLGAMLSTDEGKQRAWALLKRLTPTP